jgi:hypothetical protein
VPRRWDTHGGEDVPVYAYGLKSHLFKGVIEQTYIPYAISYASCIGPFKMLCKEHQNQKLRQSHHRILCLNNTQPIAKQYSSNSYQLFNVFNILFTNLIISLFITMQNFFYI